MVSKTERVPLSTSELAAGLNSRHAAQSDLGAIDARKELYGVAVMGGWLGNPPCWQHAFQSSCQPTTVPATRGA